MAGSILIDNKEEVLENLFDGKIFQKTARGWEKFEHTMFRSEAEPQEAETGDIWLNDTNNILYIYHGQWKETDRFLYFTEEMMSADDGNIGDYNVLSGIIQVGPIVKFGNAEELTEEDIPYAYVNKADNRLHLMTKLGDYKVNFDGEAPARTNSLAMTLINDTKLYPGLDIRKSINY